MNEIDHAVNELAGRIVAHPAQSRWWLRLSGPDCQEAIAKLVSARNGYNDETFIVMRASIHKHCGRRMAYIRRAACKCGHGYDGAKFFVCLCKSCDYARRID